jgi:hypothetical protein
MPESDFRQIQQQLEQAVSQLNDTKDPKRRRELLLVLRVLLAEADRLLLNTPD